MTEEEVVQILQKILPWSSIKRMEENSKLKEENQKLKNQIAKDQPIVEQCKAWCRYHASKRKARKEQEAYNRLLKIRELETEIKRLKRLVNSQDIRKELK